MNTARRQWKRSPGASRSNISATDSVPPMEDENNSPVLVLPSRLMWRHSPLPSALCESLPSKYAVKAGNYRYRIHRCSFFFFSHFTDKPAHPIGINAARDILHTVQVARLFVSFASQSPSDEIHSESRKPRVVGLWRNYRVTCSSIAPTLETEGESSVRVLGRRKRLPSYSSRYVANSSSESSDSDSESSTTSLPSPSHAVSSSSTMVLPVNTSKDCISSCGSEWVRILTVLEEVI